MSTNVSKHRNYYRGRTIQYQLSDDEGNDKQKARSFTERPTAGASDKYQGLADGADLKIQS